MFRRKTQRVQRMPDDFEDKYGTGHTRNPWRSLERQIQNNDSRREILDALHKQYEETLLQLQAVRKEQLLEFFAEQGITNTLHSHAKAKAWEIDGASVLALPDGWKWEHRITDAPTPYRGSYSVLDLVGPDGHTLKSTNSLQDDWEVGQEPFRRREMLMASQRVLKQLLPEPRNEQPAPTGTFGESEDE